MKESETSTDKFLVDAVNAASHSTCHSRPVGCVVVKDLKIIGSGCNGSHIKLTHCERIKQGVPSGEKLHLCPCSHAEVQAFMNLNIKEAEGSTVYVTTLPCNDCMNLLVGKRVKEVVYLTHYPNALAEKIAEGKVILRLGNNPEALSEYSNLTKSRLEESRSDVILQVSATS